MCAVLRVQPFLSHSVFTATFRSTLPRSWFCRRYRRQRQVPKGPHQVTGCVPEELLRSRTQDQASQHLSTDFSDNGDSPGPRVSEGTR